MTASSSSGSPICGRPSWSDRRGRPAEPSDWVSAGISLCQLKNKRSGLPIATANPAEEGGE